MTQQKRGPAKAAPSVFHSLSPETSLESLTERVFNQPSPLLLVRDAIQKTIEKNFQKRMPKTEAKESAEKTMKKMTGFFKQSFTQEKATNGQSKEALLEELHTDVDDQPTQKKIEQWMSGTERKVGEAKQFLNDFYTQQGKFAAFEELHKICYARAEIGGIQEGFQFVGLIGKLIDSPALIKTAQFGLGLSNVALRVTDVLANSAMKTLGMAGVMAATGNWIGLAGAAVSLLLNSGPSDQQIMFVYMQKAFKHVDKRFDHLEKQFQSMREENQTKQANRKEMLEQKTKNLIREKQFLLKEIETLQEKNTALDQQMQRIIPDCDLKTQTPPLPLPTEAKTWIESHQTLELLQGQLALLTQQAENVELEKLIDAQPPFQMFNLPIWTKAMDAYLNILRYPNVRSIYRNPLRHLHQIIAMGETALSTIEKLQREPLLFQHLWRGYANSLLFISDFYREKYQQFFDKLPAQEKGPDDVVNAIIHPERMLTEEIKYVQQELLNREGKIGSDFERYLLILQTQKDLLITFCELLGAPKALITELNQLPDQAILHQQLHNLLQFKDPVVFSQAEKLYVTLNSAAKQLSQTVFSETLPLPTDGLGPRSGQVILSEAMNHGDPLSQVPQDDVGEITKIVRGYSRTHG